jgi:hypothetical protein
MRSAREFSISGNLSSLAISEPPPPVADGDHCREMAGKVRELARYTRSPSIRRELVDLAKRYDRRGDYFDRRARDILALRQVERGRCLRPGGCGCREIGIRGGAFARIEWGWIAP